MFVLIYSIGSHRDRYVGSQNIFLLQKYNFSGKDARKSTEILQIKIYLLLYNPFQGYVMS